MRNEKTLNTKGIKYMQKTGKTNVLEKTRTVTLIKTI